MITEDYVSFETSKLLKEKGFDEICISVYHDGKLQLVSSLGVFCGEGYGEQILTYTNSECKWSPIMISAPTIQMTMKWLREVHNLVVSVEPEINTDSELDLFYVFKIFKIKDTLTQLIYNGYELCDSYEQACEAAIKYCLENLIKNEGEEEESDIPVPKTVDEAISTLVKILSDEDREYLLKNGAISMHHSLGRWIRNEWGLWTDSELKNELKKKGFEHPDDMSNYIIEEFIKYWNNKI